MTINVNVTATVSVNGLGGNADTICALAAKLDTIAARVEQIIQKEEAMNPQLQTILDKVTAQATVVASMNALVQQLSEANKKDPAAVQQILDGLQANTDSLSAAIVANTPAAAVAIQ